MESQLNSEKDYRKKDMKEIIKIKMFYVEINGDQIVTVTL